MKAFLCITVVILIFSCKKTNTEVVAVQQDTVLDEYPDWYTVKAPVDEAIQGVWGNRDKTLLILTGAENIYRSTDQGRHWQQVTPPAAKPLSGIVEYRDTLFTMRGLAASTNYVALVDGDNYSVDDGQHWRSYPGSSLFHDLTTQTPTPFFSINPVVANNQISYRINQTAVAGMNTVETPGVVTSDGRRVDLPQLHQIGSLYLDDQQRLYIAGSDAVCYHADKSLAYCNSKSGRGVIYISKKPFP